MLRIILFALLGIPFGVSGVDYFKSLEVDGQCFYLSTRTQLPKVKGEENNQIQGKCANLKLEAGRIRTAEDLVAIAEAADCHMNDTLGGQPFAHGYKNGDHGQGSPDAPCHLFDWQTHTQTHPTEGPNCDEANTEPFYICSKNAACVALPCEEHPTRPDVCVQNYGLQSFEGAKELCHGSGGVFPNILSSEDQVFFTKQAENYWISLLADPREGFNLTSGCEDAACLTTYNMTWQLPNGQATTFTQEHLRAVSSLIIDNSFPGHMHWDTKIKGQAVEQVNALCEYQTSAIPQGPPDFRSTQITCPAPAIPTEANMIIAQDKGRSCPGRLLILDCDAGGVNRIKYGTGNSTSVMCGANLEFNVPSPWPECSELVWCPSPPTHESLIHDMEEGSKGKRANESIQFDCGNELKKVILKSPRGEINATNALDVFCLPNSQYDKNILDYTCTKSCPIPNLDDTQMELTWTQTRDLEFNETMSVSCRNGHSIIDIKDLYATPEEEPVDMLDTLDLVCNESGKLTVDLSQHTCTRDCKAPSLEGSSMIHDWTKSSPPAIDDAVGYTCKTPGKMLVDSLKKELVDSVSATCRFNGKYNTDILDYECTECSVPPKVTNGYFECDSPIYEVNSTCHFYCNGDFIPTMETKTRCVYNPVKDEHEWDKSVGAKFECKRSLSVVLGGISNDKKYMDSVEIFAPGNTCHQRLGPRLPRGLMGMSADFLHGSAVLCGGASQDYFGCQTHQNGGQQCQDNTQCVTTLGGTPWCSGPKTKECLVYDKFLTQSWLNTFNLKVPRAYAASVLLPDGTLWILGGIGESRIEATTEIITKRPNGEWVATLGASMPKRRFGHCALLLPDNQNVLVVGGFGDDGYVTDGVMFNLATMTWASKTFFSTKDQSRLDQMCGTFKVSGKRTAIVIGGKGSEMTLNSLEIFNATGRYWTKVGSLLPTGVRSGGVTNVGNTVTVLGGVSCAYDSKTFNETCARVPSAYQLKEGAVIGQLSWTMLPDMLKQARSSHSVIQAPENLFYGNCGPIPVNGGFADWSEWSPCSTTCGPGSVTRDRLCNNPSPLNGGSDCSALGTALEDRECNVVDCLIEL